MYEKMNVKNPNEYVTIVALVVAFCGFYLPVRYVCRGLPLILINLQDVEDETNFYGWRHFYTLII